MKKNESNSFFYYSEILGCDDSVLAFNSYLKVYGVEIIRVELDEFNRDFKKYWGPTGYPLHNAKVSLNEIEISSLLAEIIKNRMTYGYKFKSYFLFLKSLDTLKTEVKIWDDLLAEGINYMEETRQLFGEVFLKMKLVLGCRLFKLGIFIRDAKNNVAFKGNVNLPISTSSHLLNFSEIDKAIDVEHVFGLHKAECTSLSLAVQIFNRAYLFSDERVLFLQLVIALESILNSGGFQVTHIVSRHVSLIISTSKEEFQNNFKLMKRLYGTRSQIAHGNDVKSLKQDLSQLELITRKVLIRLYSLDMEKKELFSCLNECGYGSFESVIFD